MAVQFNQRTISDFKTRLAGGGARPNLFEVDMKFPFSDDGGSEELRFMVKAAELPASNVGDIPVNFRGRILHVAGDRTFDPWTITIINNTDWDLRKKFEIWSDVMNDRTMDSGNTTPNDYQTDATVFQLDRVNKNGTEGKIPVIASYKFFGLFPTQVSSIALDYGSVSYTHLTLPTIYSV